MEDTRTVQLGAYCEGISAMLISLSWREEIKALAWSKCGRRLAVKTDRKKEMVSEICGCQGREAEMKGQCLQMRTKQELWEWTDPLRTLWD